MDIDFYEQTLKKILMPHYILHVRKYFVIYERYMVCLSCQDFISLFKLDYLRYICILQQHRLFFILEMLRGVLIFLFSSTCSAHHQWQSGSALKTGRQEVTGSILSIALVDLAVRSYGFLRNSGKYVLRSLRKHPTKGIPPVVLGSKSGKVGLKPTTTSTTTRSYFFLD